MFLRMDESTAIWKSDIKNINRVLRGDFGTVKFIPCGRVKHITVMTSVMRLDDELFPLISQLLFCNFLLQSIRRPLVIAAIRQWLKKRNKIYPLQGIQAH